MRTLLSLTTGLTLLMVGFILAARAIGGNLPPSESARWWHLTDCSLPCWGGFVIGNTPALEVEGRLRALFPPPQAAVELNTWQGRTDIAMIIGKIADGQVEEQGTVSFRFANSTTAEVSISGGNLPTLGDVFSVLGIPTCVSTGIVGTNFLILYYTGLKDGQIIEIGITPRDWTTPIGDLVINQRSINLCDKAVRWRGLTNAKRYNPDQ